MADDPGPMRIPPEILDHYAGGTEAGRLECGPSRIECARTEEILARHLPSPPARILDVGGGAGAYACRLAAAGYEAHLLDPVPLHVEQARAASAAQPENPLAAAEVGDARSLPQRDASFDVVLMLGPLYHLTARDDRLRALREARRVLRPGGLLAAAGISRFASLLDGIARGMLADPAFAAIVAEDLRSGQHRNPTGNPDWFTTAYFHHPDELRAESAGAGFRDVQLLGLEGPGWLLPEIDRRWRDPAERQVILGAARAVEGEPTLAGLSAHLLVVARA